MQKLVEVSEPNSRKFNIFEAPSKVTSPQNRPSAAGPPGCQKDFKKYMF